MVLQRVGDYLLTFAAVFGLDLNVETRLESLVPAAYDNSIAAGTTSSRYIRTTLQRLRLTQEHMVVSLNRRTPIETMKYHNPYYTDLPKLPTILGNLSPKP